MKTICRLILLTGFLLLVACTGSKTQATPTPFAPTHTPPAGRQGGAPLDVSLTELAAAPANFDGVQIRLTGRYRPLPSLICSTRRYQSPATWALASGELSAQMSGFDAQLRRLLPPDLTMTVVGTWQQWQGPVGCGKQAVTRQIWFLNVTEIVSPNPLTMVTLTPGTPGEETEVAEITATPTLDGVDAPPPTAVTPTDSAQPTPTGDDDLATPTLSAYPVETAVTPTPTSDESGNDDDDDDASPTPTSSATSDSGATATATPTSGSATNPTAAPQASATPDFNEEIIDALSSFFPGFGQLEQDEIHIWTFDLFTGDEFTISVAAQPEIDVLLSVYDPDGQALVAAQNNAPAGQVETITNVTAGSNGEYELHIRSTNGAPGHYAIILSDNSFSIRSRSILAYGEINNVSLSEDTDDIWYFYGEAGDNVTITIDPSDNQADFLILLSGPTSTGYLADVDDTGAGQNEQISNYILPGNGMYVIQVGEIDFAAAAYQIRLTRNP